MAVSLQTNTHFVSESQSSYYPIFRSQPPVFTLMVWDLYTKCSDKDNDSVNDLLSSIEELQSCDQILHEFYNILEEEYAWWKEYRTITFHDENEKEYTMNRYASPVVVNRPGKFIHWSGCDAS